MATNDPGWTANPTLVAAAASTLTLILTKFADVIMDRNNAGAQNQQQFIATLTGWNKDLQARLGVLDGQLEAVRATCTALHSENAKLSAEIIVLNARIVELESNTADLAGRVRDRPHTQRKEDKP
jgi:peptidoglycan hydrolase CwlO-like protein